MTELSTEKMQEASFKISNYKFYKTSLDFEYLIEGDFDISIDVNGKFNRSESKYYLDFFIKGGIETATEDFLQVYCEAIFEFKNTPTLKDVPPYFFKNALALIFPYVRAYISTLTVQSNVRPVILPTLNLSSLEKPLIDSTIEIE